MHSVRVKRYEDYIIEQKQFNNLLSKLCKNRVRNFTLDSFYLQSTLSLKYLVKKNYVAKSACKRVYSTESLKGN